MTSIHCTNSPDFNSPQHIDKKLVLTDLGKSLLAAVEAAKPPSQEKLEGTRLAPLRGASCDRMESKLVHHYSREEIRTQTQQSLEASKQLPLTQQCGTYQSLLGYPELEECQCIPQFQRGNSDARQKLESTITSMVEKLIKSGKKPHIAVVGSGQLLQEVHILNALSRQPNLGNLKIDFIDTTNRQDTRYSQVSTRQVQRDLVEQFCTLVGDGLGFKIARGDTDETDTCQFMNNVLDEYEESVSREHYYPENRTLEVTFFGSSQDYESFVNPEHKSSQQPNIIYDIDLESRVENHASITNPVRNVAQPGANMISVFKDRSVRGSYLDVTMEFTRKTNNGWDNYSTESFLG